MDCTNEEIMYYRDCPKCGKETNNYAYCSDCIIDFGRQGISIDMLWEIEEDAYILAGLAKLATRLY